MRLVSAVACGLHRLLDVGEEGLAFPRLHLLDPQAVVAQVEAPQAGHEARADLTEAVGLRHEHFHPAEAHAVVSLAGEAVAPCVRPSVGAEPNGIDHAASLGGPSVAFEVERVEDLETRAGREPIQLGH